MTARVSTWAFYWHNFFIPYRNLIIMATPKKLSNPMKGTDGNGGKSATPIAAGKPNVKKLTGKTLKSDKPV